MFRKLWFMAILVTAPSAQAGEALSRVPAIDDLLGLRLITGARISPDGSRVAFLERSADFELDAYLQQLWLALPSSGETFQLTRGKDSVSMPEWSPDGKWLGFLRTHEGKNQIHVIRPDGGEALLMTRSESGVEEFHWSPDGRRIAFISRVPETGEQKARKEHFGEYLVVRKDYTFAHLWLLDLKESLEKPGTGDQVTKGEDFSLLDFAWAPDSQQIAFSAARSPDLVYRHTADIYLLDVEDKSIDKTVSMEGPDTDPHWSPDGLQIVFSTFLNDDQYYARNSQLALIPAEMNRSLSLTEKFDESCRFVAWRPRGIYFSALQKTSLHLFRIDPETRAIARVSHPDELLAESFSLSSDGQKVAFVGVSSQSLPEVYISDTDSFSPRKLTESSRQIEDLKFGIQEVISWESRDGARIEGVLIRPQDFDPGKKYPLLCVIHGGPTGIDVPSLTRGTSYYPVDSWVGRGALVLRVNYRGSAGYGEKFRRLNTGNLGIGDAWDVISGIDSLIRQGRVDPDRVGCMGWSQGGYISAFLATSTNRFQAISVGAGISNWTTYYYNTDITPFTIQYLGANPVEAAETYQLTSPMSYIRQAQTPTLIQHGEFDRRVPPANAYELRQGLEDQGVPAELIIYKGFGHGIDKPKAMRAVMRHNLEWFNHYLWGDPPPDFTSPELPETGK